nr:hypothetical protein [Myxococcales bacterium]
MGGLPNWMALIAATLWGCGGTTPEEDVADADADADADTDTDADVDVDDLAPRLRVAHAAAQLGGQDMLGDGNPGNPALVDLPFKETWPMTAWATRPAG